MASLNVIGDEAFNSELSQLFAERAYGFETVYRIVSPSRVR